MATEKSSNPNPRLIELLGTEKGGKSSGGRGDLKKKNPNPRLIELLGTEKGGKSLGARRDLKERDLKKEKEELRVKSLEDDIGLRKRFALWSICLVTGYLAIVMSVVGFQMFVDECLPLIGLQIKALPTIVMVTLLTTTMVNIIALPAIIMRYLFKK